MLLVDRLPPESATKTAVRDALGEQQLAEMAAQDSDGFGTWSLTDMRLAVVIDKLSWLIHAIYHVAGAKPPAPPPFPRPGVLRVADPHTLTPEQRSYMAAFRARMLARQAKPPPAEPT